MFNNIFSSIEFISKKNKLKESKKYNINNQIKKNIY